MRWIWAAYKKGPLGELSEYFPEDMGPDEFDAAFRDFVHNAGVYCWVCEAHTSRGHVPVGMALGRPFLYDTIVLGNMTWFPWASDRNAVESAVNLIHKLRTDAKLIGFAELKDKEFIDHIMKHGVIRRVGTLHDIKDEPIAMYQSRMPKWAV